MISRMVSFSASLCLADRGEGVVGTAAEPTKFMDIALRRAWELNPHGGHMNAGHGAAVPAASGGAGRQAATLEDFSIWFCRRFARVEAACEVKSQIDVRFGQTQAEEHHIQAFNNWLEKLPGQLERITFIS